MKPAKFPGVLITAFLFFSCNDDYRDTSRARQQLVIPKESMQYDSGFLSPAYVNKGTITQNTNLSQPFTTPTDPLAAQALASITQKNTGQPFDTAATLLANGLNPPHGYPGHRCDLKVGEPLNLKPEIKTAKQELNPAHGQPGHRCDIAVGAPLNSKPAINTAQNSAVPALKNGLNPAHGQPGHRCDIAVGAPLDSKPVIVNSAADQNIAAATNNSIAADTVKVDSLKN
jgi:uncharacterized protein YvpB